MEKNKAEKGKRERERERGVGVDAILNRIGRR